MSDHAPVLVVEDVKETADWLTARVHAALGAARTVRQAHTLAAARKLMQREHFHMAILDLGLPDGNGIELIPELTAGRDTTVVVATIYDDDTHIFSALRAGAGGYLLKDQGDEDIEKALAGIRDGVPPISPSVARRMMDFFVQQERLRENPDNEKLTGREKEVLVLIANGLSVGEASASLGISAHTTRGYVKDIYRKLGISSRAEASLSASRLGLIRK